MLEFLYQVWGILATGDLPNNLSALSYLFIALLVAVEGPVATVVAATLAGAGALDPWLVVVSAAAGNIAADLLWYGLGRTGFIHWFLRRLPWLRNLEPQIAQLEGRMQGIGLRLLFAAKLVVWAAAIPTLIAAGAARLSWRKVLGVVALSEVLWTGSLVLLSDSLSAHMLQFQAWMQWLATGGMIVFMLLLPTLLRRLYGAASRR
jgi:membrane protein DedA with SNARE-associated domain